MGGWSWLRRAGWRGRELARESGGVGKGESGGWRAESGAADRLACRMGAARAPLPDSRDNRRKLSPAGIAGRPGSLRSVIYASACSLACRLERLEPTGRLASRSQLGSTSFGSTFGPTRVHHSRRLLVAMVVVVVPR